MATKILEPILRFTELRNSNLHISDSELLNSNNQGKFTGKADVVVAGAGIIGLLYAIYLKQISPQLKIEVFEKSQAPMQKIGESRLSSFSRLVLGEIIPQEYLLRLFGLKEGLQFYCIDNKGLSVTSEDIGGLDISFQLDHRVSELFFTMWAQKMGINVYHGIDVAFQIRSQDEIKAPSNPSAWKLPAFGRQSPKPEEAFTTPRVLLKDFSGTLGPEVNARLVVDATGFSRKLTSKFGKRESFAGWNCDAYWAYFKEKPTPNVEDRLQHWDYPATKHICFPEGWGWFIKLISWCHAPLPNLMDLLDCVITAALNKTPVNSVPCTASLSNTFSCPYEFITSIGWAVRNDYILPSDLISYGQIEGEQKFTYFQRKYPTLDLLMTKNYDLLPKYYGKQTYFVKKTFAYRPPIVAGEGWFAIGNAAGFTNPLISPGINAGVGSAWLAASLTKMILSADANRKGKQEMEKGVKVFQDYMHEYMLPCLWNMNRYWYSLFRSHQLFEALVPCYWALSVDDIGIQYDSKFDDEDLRWLVGSRGDAFQSFAKELAVAAPDGHELSEEMILEVERMSKRCLRKRAELYPGNMWGAYLRKYGHMLERVSGKNSRTEGANFKAARCEGCQYWVFDYACLCPVCGTTRICTS